MHAARGKAARVRSAGLFSGDCGAGRDDGGCAVSRSIFSSCSVNRASCSSARLICSWACTSLSSARALRASWGSVSFGVEFIGVSFPSNVIRSWPAEHPAALRAVLPKEWPHDGRIWDHMAIASWHPAGHARRPSRTVPRLSPEVPIGRREARNSSGLSPVAYGRAANELVARGEIISRCASSRWYPRFLPRHPGR